MNVGNKLHGFQSHPLKVVMHIHNLCNVLSSYPLAQGTVEELHAQRALEGGPVTPATPHFPSPASTPVPRDCIDLDSDLSETELENDAVEDGMLVYIGFSCNTS